MIDANALVESDLGDTIEGEFGILITLISPTGISFKEKKGGGSLKGFVRHSYKDTRPQRGANDQVIINSPVVKFRLSSLPVIPETGAEWTIGISDKTISGAEIDWYLLDPNKPVEVNRDKGTVKLFLVKLRAA